MTVRRGKLQIATLRECHRPEPLVEVRASIVIVPHAEGRGWWHGYLTGDPIPPLTPGAYHLSLADGLHGSISVDEVRHQGSRQTAFFVGVGPLRMQHETAQS